MGVTAPQRAGWCPSVFDPMMSGDGLLVRIKPSASSLTMEQAITIAEAAARFGNGIIELTNRANLQLRGLHADTIEPLSAAIVSAGAASPDPAIERIRNVMANPMGDDDSAACLDSSRLAKSLEDQLCARPKLVTLPPKFGFLVDGGGILPLRGVRADIRLQAHAGGVAILLDGSETFVLCAAADSPRIAADLAAAFIDLAARSTKEYRRMRSLIDAIGADAVFRTAGLQSISPQGPVSADRQPLDFTSPLYLAFGLPHGQIEAPALIGLAHKVRAAGALRIGITPWRTLIIPGLSSSEADAVRSWAREAGLITEAEDPRTDIAACSGTPACRSATVATRRDAAVLAALGVTRGRRVHVSGCAKGCARPDAADFTLVGSPGGLYSLVRDGRAHDKPSAVGLTLDQVAQHMRGN